VGTVAWVFAREISLQNTSLTNSRFPKTLFSALGKMDIQQKMAILEQRFSTGNNSTASHKTVVRNISALIFANSSHLNTGEQLFWINHRRIISAACRKYFSFNALANI